MTNENLLTKLISEAKKLGADKVDAMAYTKLEFSAEIRMGKTEKLESAESSAIGLRAIIGKKQALFSTSDLREESLKQFVENTVRAASLAEADPFIDIYESKPTENVENLELYDDAELSLGQLKNIAKEAEDAALAVEKIINSNGSEASYGKTHVIFMNSRDVQYQTKSSFFSNSLSVVAAENGLMETDYDYSTKRFLSDLDSPAKIGRTAGQRTVERLGARKVPSTKCPVVFDARVSKNIISLLASAINGSLIARGTSFLLNEMGKDVFSSSINIIDDPRIKRGLMSQIFDGEAVPSQKLYLVENGKLTNMLLDIKSANQLKTKTNGRASRSIGSMPSPSSTNLYLENGKVSVEEMVQDIKDGLYITSLFGNGVNIVTGDYSQGAVGFKIENGKITYPVNEITIASNLKDMFKQLVPANDLEFKYGTNSPTILIPEMTIAGL